MKKKFSIILLMLTIFISKTNLQAMDMDLEDPAESVAAESLPPHEKARKWYYVTGVWNLAFESKRLLYHVLTESEKGNYLTGISIPDVDSAVKECEDAKPEAITKRNWYTTCIQVMSEAHAANHWCTRYTRDLDSFEKTNIRVALEYLIHPERSEVSSWQELTAGASVKTCAALDGLISHVPVSEYARTSEHVKNTELFFSFLEAFTLQEILIKKEKKAQKEAERRRRASMREYYRPGNPRRKTLMLMR